jgi:hypothetical protein
VLPEFSAAPPSHTSDTSISSRRTTQACDVLYEAGAVGPIAELAPRLLFTSGGRLLLADPAERTVQNRYINIWDPCPCAARLGPKVAVLPCRGAAYLT